MLMVVGCQCVKTMEVGMKQTELMKKMADRIPLSELPTPAQMRKIRIGLGFTQQDVADLLEMDVSTIHAWETGKLKVGAKNRVKVRDAFNQMQAQL